MSFFEVYGDAFYYLLYQLNCWWMVRTLEVVETRTVFCFIRFLQQNSHSVRLSVCLSVCLSVSFIEYLVSTKVQNLNFVHINSELMVMIMMKNKIKLKNVQIVLMLFTLNTKSSNACSIFVTLGEWRMVLPLTSWWGEKMITRTGYWLGRNIHNEKPNQIRMPLWEEWNLFCQKVSICQSNLTEDSLYYNLIWWCFWIILCVCLCLSVSVPLLALTITNTTTTSKVSPSKKLTFQLN